MAIEDYWASSARIANDVAKYGLYPLAKLVAIATFKDTHKAIGLENRGKKAESTSKGFVDRLGRAFVDLQLDSYRGLFGKTRKFQESVSQRDPGEVPYTLS